MVVPGNLSLRTSHVSTATDKRARTFPTRLLHGRARNAELFGRLREGDLGEGVEEFERDGHGARRHVLFVLRARVARVRNVRRAPRAYVSTPSKHLGGWSQHVRPLTFLFKIPESHAHQHNPSANPRERGGERCMLGQVQQGASTGARVPRLLTAPSRLAPGTPVLSKQACVDGPLGGG